MFFLPILGWIGLILLVVYTLVSSYTGGILGESWLMILNRYPEYKTHCPDPYPTLAEKTFGKKGRLYVVILLINVKKVSYHVSVYAIYSMADAFHLVLVFSNACS
jgi:hypothetical protein